MTRSLAVGESLPSWMPGGISFRTTFYSPALSFEQRSPLSCSVVDLLGLWLFAALLRLILLNPPLRVYESLAFACWDRVPAGSAGGRSPLPRNGFEALMLILAELKLLSWILISAPSAAESASRCYIS